MKRVFHFICLILLASAASAQRRPSGKSISFINDEGKSVTYDRVITWTKKAGFKVEDFYQGSDQLAEVAITPLKPEYHYFLKEGKFRSFYENGQLKEDATYLQNDLKGVRSQYFENGRLFKRSLYVKKNNILISLVNEVWDQQGNQLVREGQGRSTEISDLTETGNYVDGLKDSVWTGTYPDGKLCYQETYTKGILVSGTSSDPEGKTHEYTQMTERAVFEGGIDEFWKFINKSLKHPRNRVAKETVNVSFRIEKDGSVKEAFLMNEESYAANDEVIRIALLTSGKWTPGKKRGLPQPSWFDYNISFFSSTSRLP
jgi:hypothetical protein